jgi:sugar phosphate isomerase/epimerase
MMAGIVKSSLPEGRALSASAAIAAAAGQGLDALLFNSLFDLSDTLDSGALAEVAAEASRQGIALSATLGAVNPALPLRGDMLVKAGNGDFEAGLRRLVTLAADIGIRDQFFVIGMIEDRFSTEVDWQAQRDAVAALILRLAPVLRERGARLLLKTHEEITTTEIVELVRRVGPDLLGVALDPVNVVCRMEEPLAAARRVAPYVASIHVDDAILRFEPDGVRRYLAPVGEGVLDWNALLALVPQARIWLEMHSGQFSMPVFDPDWLRAQPDIAVAEYGAVLALANRWGSRPVPWDQSRPTDRLPQAFRMLRS